LRPAAFLDRDGVLLRLRRDPDGARRGPRSAGEAELIEGAESAVQDLADHGYICIVVTNQPDIARGKQTLEQLSGMNQYLRSRLAIHDIYACCHDSPDGCRCRKPSPGMLVAAAFRHRLDLAASVMFGDRRSDALAARAAGCRFCWITADAQDAVPEHPAEASAATLREAVSALLAEPRHVNSRRKEPIPDVGYRYLYPG